MTSRTIFWVTGSIIAVSFLLTGCSSSGKKTPQEIPLTVEAIQDITAQNHPELESEVELDQVIVTSRPVAPDGSQFSVGFFIQDPGPAGPNKGIYVRSAPDLPRVSQLKPGDTISLKGIYREIAGNSTISSMNPGQIQHLANGEPPQPAAVTLEQIRLGAPEAEAYEGVLVRIESPEISAPPDNLNYFQVGGQGGLMVMAKLFGDQSWADYVKQGMVFEQLVGHIYQDDLGSHLAPGSYADFGSVVSMADPEGDQKFWGDEAQLTITANKAGAQIHYTTDGSDPAPGQAGTESLDNPALITMTQNGTLSWASGYEQELEQVQQIQVSLTKDFFTEISESSGIQEENFDPDPQISIASNEHSLIAFADLNGDGLDDIVASNTYPNPKNSEMPQEHLTFLNNGDKTFTNFSDDSGLRLALGTVLAFGDLDNDGDLDVFSAFSWDDEQNSLNQVYLNDGSAHFSAKTDDGFADISYPAVAASALLVDVDGDGDLDIFVSNGHTAYNSIDRLFINDGTGAFSDGTDRLVGNESRVSNGAVTCDFDNDGDQDIIVTTYGISRHMGHNLLWQNDGAGNFTEVAAAHGWDALATGSYWPESTGYGLDIEPNPDPEGYTGSNGFGVDCADVNNDGLLDIISANIAHPDTGREWGDPSAVLINQGPDAGFTFVNEYLNMGIPFNEGELDCSTADFDNDGRLDLGKTRENKYESRYTDQEQFGWFGLMHQNSDGTFQSVGLFAGINSALDNPDDPFLKVSLGHTHAWSDIDRDGDLDLLIGGGKNSNIPARGRPNFLFENTIGQSNHWLSLRLVGDGSLVNTDALGARVTFTRGEELQMREIKSSRGLWNPVDSRRVHLGLGADEPGDYQIQVRWPDGRLDNYDQGDLPADSFITIHYSDGIQPE